MPPYPPVQTPPVYPQSTFLNLSPIFFSLSTLSQTNRAIAVGLLVLTYNRFHSHLFCLECPSYTPNPLLPISKSQSFRKAGIRQDLFQEAFCNPQVRSDVSFHWAFTALYHFRALFIAPCFVITFVLGHFSLCFLECRHRSQVLRGKCWS